MKRISEYFGYLSDLFFYTAASLLAVLFTGRGLFPLASLSLIGAALFLFQRNRRRDGSFSPAALFALGLIGGEGIACLKLSRLSTAWTKETWLSFYLAYLLFYLCYYAVRRIRAGEKEGEGREKGEKPSLYSDGEERERRLSFYRISILSLLALSLSCFLFEAWRLRFIPLFTVNTPHAYSYFHLPAIHYFTTLYVLLPSVAALYRRELGRKSLLALFGALCPLFLSILLVSRFQFLFSLFLLLFSLLLLGERLSRGRLLLLFFGALSVYVLITIERAHSIRYLNGIFEMKYHLPIFLSQPYIYIANNYDNFNEMTLHLREHSHGLKLLYPFLTLSGIKYFFTFPLAWPDFVTKKELTTLSILYDSWYDFGLFGVALFSCLLASVSALLHSLSGRNPFGLLFRAQLSFYLLFSFFTTWFSNPAVWFYLFATALLYFAFQRFCLSRGERGEGEAQLGEGRKS
ncbi:hypothetical protein GCWU000341_01363 [Oribacterium sp. oral taxon 078 str. F0262]|uniref:O-antigen polymerase n=1 Tax=Oribacterium sp. oral taxon 078 TaxID=652706 RepID=UPI0001BCBB25|nr:O-antigen polymerase [Oribacterium sp. oral taxon 078]EFE92173.1 hypothetical protein GCWU000341_01363 [Oribacterium sp. oral taxon 078 str. F0262]